MEKIGLEAVLEDKNFQAGLARMMQSMSKLPAHAEQTATQTTSAWSRLSSHFVITAGDIGNAVGTVIAKFAQVATHGQDTTRAWANDIDRLGDQFGLTGKDASAFTLLANKVGLSVDEMGMGLNTFTRGMAETVKVTKDGKRELTPFGQALDKIGIKAFDAKGKLKTFDQVLPEVLDAFQKMPAGVNKSALAMELFGARGGSKFLDFLSQGSKGLDDAKKKAVEWGLALETDTVDAVEQLGFAQNELSLQFKGIWNQIGVALLPAMKDLTAFISKEVLPAFTVWAKENAPKITAALRALGDWMMKEGIPALKNFANWIKKDAIPALQKLGKWIKENVIPVIEVLVKWFKVEMPKAGKSAQQTWDTIQKAIKGAWDKIEPIVSAIVKELSRFWNEIQPKIEKAWKNIAKTIKEVWAEIKKIIEPAVRAIVKFIEDHWEEIENIISGVMKTIQGIVKVAWAAIQGIIKIALDILGGDFEEAGRDWEKMMRDIWDGIKLVFSGAWQVIETIVRSALQALWNAIDAKMREIYNTIKSIWDSAVSAVQNTATNLYNAGRNAIQGLLNGVNSLVTSVYNAITQPIRDAGAFILSVDWWGIGRNALQRIGDGINSIASWFYDTFIRPIQDAAYWVLTRDWWGIGRSIFDSIGRGIESLRNFIVGALQGPFDAVINAFNALLNALGIRSPSAKMAYVGAMMAEGLQRGWGNPVLQFSTEAVAGGLPRVASYAGAGGGSSVVNSNATTNNYYNLSVNSLAPTSTLVSDFGIMRALAGG